MEHRHGAGRSVWAGKLKLALYHMRKPSDPLIRIDVRDLFQALISKISVYEWSDNCQTGKRWWNFRYDNRICWKGRVSTGNSLTPASVFLTALAMSHRICCFRILPSKRSLTRHYVWADGQCSSIQGF